MNLIDATDLGPDWFLTNIFHIHTTLWQAVALSVGDNPLAGHKALGEGQDLPSALSALSLAIAAGDTYAPPSQPAATPSLNLLSILNLPPKPIATGQIRRS